MVYLHVHCHSNKNKYTRQWFPLNRESNAMYIVGLGTVPKQHVRLCCKNMVPCTYAYEDTAALRNPTRSQSFPFSLSCNNLGKLDLPSIFAPFIQKTTNNRTKNRQLTILYHGDLPWIYIIPTGFLNFHYFD